MSQQTFEQTRWSLKDLLPAPKGPEMDRILAELEEAIAQLEAHRDQLSPDMPDDVFLEVIALLEKIDSLQSRLSAYGGLWFAEDTQNQNALAFRGRMEKLLTDFYNRTLFFTLWWKELDDQTAQRWTALSGDVAYYLESLRRFKPHLLSEPEEKIINLKDVNGSAALTTLYDMITNRFVFKLEIDGEVKELTRSELMVYARDPSPDLRAAAYQEMYRVYSEQATILGQIYQYLVRDWATENLSLRRFSSPIAVRNLNNDIPDPVVDTLLEVCHQNAVLFQRYFRLKADWLGLDRLRRYDIYAPFSDSQKRYAFDEAAHLVLDSLAGFAPQLADHARRVFADGHLDSEIRPGKDSGAFCASPLPGLTPWILLNYNGQVSDVTTMAHELGHAIHSLMAADHSPLTYRPPLPLAETASVFCEMLLIERLLRDESDLAVRRDILGRSLDEAYGTVMRQAYFVLFERQAHALIQEGQTTRELAEHYMANLQEQFGDAVALSDEFRWEWLAVPHIYQVPFYCYAYSFGQLLVLSLYQQYRKEGQSFIPKYFKVLAYGGSTSPAAILDEAGIDMAAADFWQGGFDVIAGMIDQLEALTGEQPT